MRALLFSFTSRRFRTRLIRLALMVAVSSAAGCAGPDLLNWPWHGMPQASADNPVVRVLGIWEPAEGNGLDGLPTRGLAGQIFFFTAGSPLPVKVDGDVRIYLFDDYGTSDEQAKPIHQFDFLGQAWTVHLRKSTLGPSYQLFIPYVRKQPDLVNCGLRIRLTPRTGPVIYSDMVNITLPGPQRDGARPGNASGVGLQPLPSKPPVSKTGQQAASNAGPSLGASLTRQTIPLASLVQANGTLTQADNAGTRNEDRSDPVSPAPHPLRFKLEPAEFVSKQADEEHPVTTHPLASPQAPKHGTTYRQRAFRRHPLADQTEPANQAEGELHRHPLAEE